MTLLARAAAIDLGRPLAVLRVDGGLTRSRVLMQTAGRPAPDPGRGRRLAARHCGRRGRPGPARCRSRADARRRRPPGRFVAARYEPAIGRRRGSRAPGPLRATPSLASGATSALGVLMTDDRALRRRDHRCRGRRHCHRASTCALPASHGRARARRRRRHRNLEGEHRHRAHRVRHPARAASSPAGPARAPAADRLRRRRRASRSRRPGPSWSPGMRSRRPGSTTCSPSPGRTGTSAPPRWRSRSSTGASRTSRKERPGPSPSPTSRSSVRGARASPSPPRRSAPASSSGSAPRSPMSGTAGRLALADLEWSRARPTGWSTQPASGLGPAQPAVRSRRIHHRARVVASSSSSTSWPARSCPSIVLPVPSERTKGVLVAPTVYGNVLLGPTAEDIADPERTPPPRPSGLAALLEAGRRILPELVARRGHRDLRRHACRHASTGTTRSPSTSVSATPASGASGPPA